MQNIFANTKFLEREQKYFQTVWNTLGRSGNARIFTAQHTTNLIGAYLVVNDRRCAYELYGGVTRAGRVVEAGYLLKWEAMRYYNSLGMQFYDHWGVAPQNEAGEYDAKDELYQISRFKAGFGGSYVAFPGAKVLVISEPKYRLFLAGQKVQQLKTKLAKLLK